MQTRYRLILHSHAEKTAIALIRDAAAGGAGRNPAFTELARCAESHGLAILGRDAPSLSMDEINLLACLAVYQRKSVSAHHAAVSDLDRSLMQCAAELAERTTRLPFRAIQRVEFVRQQSSAGIVPELR